MELNKYRDKYNQLLGQKNQIQKMYDKDVGEFKEYETKYKNALITQSLIQKASKATQEDLKFSIEPIVTSAIESVFGDEGYTFNLEFTTKSNRTHCVPTFIDEDKEPFDSLEDLGGSISDVGAFASRISLWTLAGKNKTAPIFLLDESMKHLSEGYRELGSDLLKSICDKLGVQIIISTHLPVLVTSANNRILVEKKRGVSVAHTS